MVQCDQCGLQQADQPETHINYVVHNGDLWCFDCRKAYLVDETILSEREADVMALKQITGKSHEDISDELELDKSTVDEYSRRAREKFFRAAETVQALETHI